MKLSIITINYNNRDGLERTLKSVKAQIDRNFEYIVVDGGSTDGSVDLIHQYSEIIDKWVSEPDSGIYNAMNKGVTLACGEYVNFLNSGDELFDSNVVKYFNSLCINSDVITGIETSVSHEKNDGEEIIGVTNPIEDIDMLVYTLMTSSISHGASFIKTNLLKENPYDEYLKIVSDWKFFLEQIVGEKVSYSPWDMNVNRFDMSGISNSQRKMLEAERAQVLSDFAPQRLLSSYFSHIEGRSELERMIKHERPDGVLAKILTMVGRSILSISHITQKIRK